MCWGVHFGWVERSLKKWPLRHTKKDKRKQGLCRKREVRASLSSHCKGPAEGKSLLCFRKWKTNMAGKCDGEEECGMNIPCQSYCELSWMRLDNYCCSDSCRLDLFGTCSWLSVRICDSKCLFCIFLSGKLICTNNDWKKPLNFSLMCSIFYNEPDTLRKVLSVPEFLPLGNLLYRQAICVMLRIFT